MPYQLLITATFEEKLHKLKLISDRVEKIKKQLIESPYTGKPLGYPFFREKKINGLRLYFLIYEDYKIVYIITLSNKKEQQATINTIKMFLEKYKQHVEEFISRV